MANNRDVESEEMASSEKDTVSAGDAWDEAALPPDDFSDQDGQDDDGDDDAAPKKGRAGLIAVVLLSLLGVGGAGAAYWFLGQADNSVQLVEAGTPQPSSTDGTVSQQAQLVSPADVASAPPAAAATEVSTPDIPSAEANAAPPLPSANVAALPEVTSPTVDANSSAASATVEVQTPGNPESSSLASSLPTVSDPGLAPVENGKPNDPSAPVSPLVQLMQAEPKVEPVPSNVEKAAQEITSEQASVLSAPNDSDTSSPAAPDLSAVKVTKDDAESALANENMKASESEAPIVKMDPPEVPVVSSRATSAKPVVSIKEKNKTVTDTAGAKPKKLSKPLATQRVQKEVADQRKTAVKKADPVKPVAVKASSESKSKVKYIIRSAMNGQAWIQEDLADAPLRHVVVGDKVTGLGMVKAIEQIDGAWKIVGSQRTID